MRAKLAMAAALAAAAVAPVRPHADELGGTYNDGDVLVETGHAVGVTRAGRLARFTVERSFRNRGAYPEEASLQIDIPSGAVARGLRVRLGGRWFAGELLDAEKAEDRYAELTGAGKLGRRGPALLSSSGAGDLHLKLFPLPPRAEVAVQYTLEAPLCYRDGLLLTDYPGAAAPRLLRPTLAAPAPARIETEEALRKRLDIGPDDELCPGIGLPPRGPRRVITWAAEVAGPLQARFAQVAVDADHHLVRVQVDVPPVIEPAPHGARVVLVIDGSRSQGYDGIGAQLELARGFVQHLPDASVEVIVYRRGAERLFRRFVPAAAVAAALDQVPPARLAPGNGSHADLGLELAGLALDGAGGPARVLLFTDDRLRTGFDVAVARRNAAALPAGAVLHVVDIGPGAATGASWERDDEHRLFEVARVRGGIAARITGSPTDLADAAEAMLGLVRPLVIDKLAIDGVPESLGLPEALHGGDAWRDIQVRAAAPSGWILRGRVWSREFSLPLRSDAGAAAELGALAFGHAAGNNLPEAGAAALARRAGVVSAHTSLLARDPDAPPAGVPDEWGLGLRGTSGTCSCGGFSTSSSCGIYGTIGHGSGTGEPYDPPDREGMLAGALRMRAAACAGSAGLAAVELVVEATGDEIVDVAVTGAPAPAAACIADAAWVLELPRAYFDLENGRYAVRF